VRAPEITTFRPAFDGFGEEAMVRVPATQGSVQQPADGQHGCGVVLAVAQHVPGWQQSVGWQQMGCGGPPTVGTGQQGGTCGLASGQGIAVAGLGAASIQIAAAATRSESGTIRRRIAGTDGRNGYCPG
jgi:hypothetical protein